MTLSPQIRQQVRLRANFACEYCDVAETDSGGQLTIDHFQPRSKGGTDEISNLIYCCIRCNQHKLDYWPSTPTDPALWNPRQESRKQHFRLLENGELCPLTPTGEFTLRRLRLNRPLLIKYRLSKKSERDKKALLAHYQEMVELLTEISIKQAQLMNEQQDLLREQTDLLRILLKKHQDLS
ncbi:MAG: HNH endonuclease [Cyanobacteria bacterium P01_G01_bin.54]